MQDSRQEIYAYENILDHYEQRSKLVTKERIVGYEEVVVGHKDLGNGYFEEITENRPIYETYTETEYYEEPIYRKEPVYKTKYYYEIDKWLYDRSVSSSGSTQKTYWPDVSELTKNERTSTKTESYYVIGVNSNEESKKIEIPYESWLNLEVDQQITVRVSILGKGELIN